MTEEEKTEKTEEKQEEKQGRDTLSMGALLTITNVIEKNLCEEHHLSSAEIMFIGTMLQASATNEYMIHNLIKRAHVQIVEMRPEQHPEQHTEFKMGQN